MNLTEQLGEALRHRGWTISTVESCTAGGLAHRITDAPGASAYFVGSLVAYANRVKSEWGGVPETLFRDHGAVSAQVAGVLADQGRRRFVTDLCVAITGIAGPGGGTPDKPVGTVFISATGPDSACTERFLFPGGREEVRRAAVEAALEMALRLTSTS